MSYCCNGLGHDANRVAQGFARELAKEVEALGFQADVMDLKDYDPEDKLSDEVSLVLF